MFAKALNRLVVWWRDTLAAERSFVGVGGGPGCPPMTAEQAEARVIGACRPDLLRRDLACAAMVESMQITGVDLAEPETYVRSHLRLPNRGPLGLNGGWPNPVGVDWDALKGSLDQCSFRQWKEDTD